VSAEAEKARFVADAERALDSALAKVTRAKDDLEAAKEAVANAKTELEAVKAREFVWVEPTESVTAASQ
jgi:flagellar biosynthesis regulator FlaF